MAKIDNIMLDMETLGVTADSVILSIGAVKFNMEGEFDDKAFYAILRTDQNRHINPETLAWWMGQSAEARSIFTAPNKIGLEQALADLCEWVDHSEYYLWSNGADFDIPILNHALRTHGMPPVAKFWNHRCFRTMKTMFSQVPKPPFEGTAHNALADAVHQAKWLIAIEKFRKTGELPPAPPPKKGFGAKA